MDSTLKRIGLIINKDKPQFRDVLHRVSTLAASLNFTLVACEKHCGEQADVHMVTPEAFPDAIDYLLALGGDGTMLHAVSLLRERDVPILGVNLGNLGFLTAVPLNDLEEALKALAMDDIHITDRSMLHCDFRRNGESIATFHALNDVVAGWGQSTRILTFSVEINGQDVTDYRCDGVVVSTPTGSTGHSLSANGPILHPETPALLLNVICAHSLSARPIIMPDDRIIRIRITDASSLLLSVDGQQVHTMQQGDELVFRKAGTSVRFVQLHDYCYFSVLRQKLQWSGSSAWPVRR